MIDSKIFNKEVSKFLIEKGSDSKVLTFKKSNINHSSYLDFLDWFAFDLGFMFFNIEVVDAKNHEKTLGFSPELRFYNDNVFHAEVGDFKLSEEWLDLKMSSTILARETMSKIFSLNNLDLFTKKTANS